MKKFIIGAVMVLTIASSLLLFAAKGTQAQNASDNSEILNKLNEVLDNEKSILRGISSMQEELNIIKIRVTQQQ